MNKVAKIEPTEVVPQSEGTAIIQMIERMAMDPSVDISRLERMLEMKTKLDADTQKRAFNTAFAACQAEIPQVIKNQNNSQTKSKYADLAAIEKAVTPVFTSHGFSVRMYPKPCEAENHTSIECVVSHAGGHSETYAADVPNDGTGLKGNSNMTSTHAFGSTISYGRRYLLCMIFNIATADNDGNNQVQQTISAEQFVELQSLIEKAGADADKFLLAYKAERLEQFPSRSFAHAKAQLDRKISEAK